MRQVLVQNTGALSTVLTNPGATPPTVAAADPTQLPVGKLGAFNEDGIVNFAAAAPDSFFLCVNRGGGRIERTNLLHLEKINRVVLKEYEAPVNNTVTVVVTGPATGVGEVNLKVQDTYSGVEPYIRYNFDTRVASGDTAVAIATRLIEAINAQPNLPFTATRSSATLTLTATERESFLRVSFQAAGYDGSNQTGVGANVTTTAFSIGSGTPEDVRDIAQYHAGNVGRYYLDDPILGSQAPVPTYEDDSRGYDFYTILHETPFDLAINKSVRYQEITIAVGSDVTGSLNTFFGDKLDDKDA